MANPINEPETCRSPVAATYSSKMIFFSGLELEYFSITIHFIQVHWYSGSTITCTSKRYIVLQENGNMDYKLMATKEDDEKKCMSGHLKTSTE